MTLNIERLANSISNHFDKVEERIEELVLHFERIHDQLHGLCEVISNSDMQVDHIMNGGTIICESELYFHENGEPNLCFNEKMPISHDHIFGTNFEPQEASIKDSNLTLF